MSLTTIDAPRFRDAYGRLEEHPAGSAAAKLKAAIDAAYTAAQDSLQDHGFTCDGGDDAESLVGALVWYALKNNPSWARAAEYALELGEPVETFESSPGRWSYQVARLNLVGGGYGSKINAHKAALRAIDKAGR